MHLAFGTDMDEKAAAKVRGKMAKWPEQHRAMGERLHDLIVKTASGQASKSESLGFGEAEFAPWQLGAVM